MDKANTEMLEILRGLIENWENEVVEFKQASNSFKLDDIGYDHPEYDLNTVFLPQKVGKTPLDMGRNSR